MNAPILRALLAFGAASLAPVMMGCGHVEVRDVVLRADDGTGTHDRAALYVGTQKPPRPVYETAMLDAIGTGDDATVEALTQALVDRATALGCDAVMRVRVEIGRMSSHAYGVCVRYTTGPAVSPAVASAPKVVPAPEAPAPAAPRTAPAVVPAAVVPAAVAPAAVVPAPAAPPAAAPAVVPAAASVPTSI